MPAEGTFTLLIDGDELPLSARVEGDSVQVPAENVTAALGWEIKQQGLCKGEVCIPVRDENLFGRESVDLAVLARLIGRPLALDSDERAGCFASSPQERAAQLNSLEAPDFTLPDLDGRMHSLSDYRGRKVFLLSWGSY